jgi:hypothetical protein
MIKELYDLYRWGELHELYELTIPKAYVGHADFLKLDIVKEFYAVHTKEAAEKWVQEDILDHYATPCMCGKCNPEQNPDKPEYRVHLVRVTAKIVNIVQNACISKGIVFRNHTSTDRLTEEETNEFFKEPLTHHIVLGVKGFFRRANLIPNRWKLRIGATLELYTKIVDNNVQIQGLTGRMTGYWRDDIEAGHKTGPHRTSITAIQEYEATYSDPFGLNSYQSAGFSKRNGSVFAAPTMLSDKHIMNLVPVDLPEIDKHPEYAITDLFDTKDNVDARLDELNVKGRRSTYREKENHIQCRGVTTPLYTYESHNQFKKLDIYRGINKEVADNKISCRIMPVIHEGVTKYIGIYRKVGGV